MGRLPKKVDKSLGEDWRHRRDGVGQQKLKEAIFEMNALGSALVEKGWDVLQAPLVTIEDGSWVLVCELTREVPKL